MSLTDKINREQVLGAQSLITAASHIVILTHMSPDGDAMGSSLALYHWLQLLGKQVNVIVPNTYPDFLAWMPAAKQVLIYENQQQEADKLLDTADLIICADFNEPKRISIIGDKMLQLREDNKHLRLLLIDHHINPAAFADVTISYSDSPSTCELVYRLIYQMKMNLPDTGATNRLTKECATCIYTGMMTDTGNFSFNSNHAEMYCIVSDLVESGVNKDEVYNEVFNSYVADRMRLMGYCLYRKMEILEECHTALIYLSRKELYRFNFRSGDAEGIVNLPLQIKDIHYSCFMREDKVMPHEKNKANGSKTKIKISLRSQGDRPVNVFAHDIFSGGGHANASGGEYYGSLADAVERFKANYPKYFKKD